MIVPLHEIKRVSAVTCRAQGIGQALKLLNINFAFGD
jgi:hypothetical protein